MSQSKKDPNEEWRQAFENASETPPPTIWEAIERHLDQQTVAPLTTPWWKKPQSWLSAASVLLILGIGTIIFFANKETSAPTKEMVTSQIDVTPPTQAPASGTPESNESQKPNSNVNKSNQETGFSESGLATKSKEISRNTPNSAVFSESSGRPSPVSLETIPETNIQPSAVPGISDNRDQDLALEGAPKAAQPQTLEFLEPLDFQEPELHWQTRYVFFNPYSRMPEEEPLPALKAEAGPLWAGVSLMPGGFNPNMQFSHRSVYQMNNVVGTSAYNTSNGQPYLGANNRSETKKRDQPKVSYQAVAQFGVNLSGNWSVESGLAFLQGNSTSRSPGFFIDRSSARSADLLMNAVVSGGANYPSETFEMVQLKSSDAESAAIYMPIDRDMSNTFSYLQVPVYAGYTFRADKKFSYTLLGGGITNFFLKNSLHAESGYTLKTTPENNVYSNIVVSAATGLRLNYRLNQAWNTNLTANYQHALMNSFNENRFLSSRPKVYGIAWGVRYTFQR